jgi:hypothetical protein
LMQFKMFFGVNNRKKYLTFILFFSIFTNHFKQNTN